ncbi:MULTISPECIES: cache domain-containing protein [Rhodomicrobium]|uniref:cache domain-containing protein n=1 Tax=Rhodomicrobium TaxID=1068 RepID=UPI000F74247F|nr:MULTISPECIES: cache domain-containing protein [Rhodomicrobium]
MFRLVYATAAVLACFVGGQVPALGEEAHIVEVKRYIALHVVPWLRDHVVVDAVQAQNFAHAELTDTDVERLDQQWRRELDSPSKPLIDSVLNNPLSLFLKEKQAASDGYIGRLVVMDEKGMNVGQSGLTDDYWQGDEVKWQKSFKKRTEPVFVDNVEKDATGQRLQIPVSLPVVDPESGLPIGAITVNINVERLPTTF